MNRLGYRVTDGQQIEVIQGGRGGQGSRKSFAIVVISTILVLAVGKIVYFKSLYYLKNDLPIDWSGVFHYSDFSFSVITTVLVALVYLALGRLLRRLIPERSVALRYGIQFVLTAVLGGAVAAANMVFYSSVLYDFEIPSALMLVDTAILAFITPVTLMAALETFHYRGAWLQEQYRFEQKKRETVSAQFEALKNQLSPHFVFNSFNTLGGLIEEDPKQAQRFLGQLSQVYRFILENKDNQTVPLARELESVKALLAVQEARHPGAVKVEIDLPSDAGAYLIIPLTLHTLVENVFKHNVMSPQQPISVKIAIVHGEILVVQNDLRPKLDVESHKMGIANLSRRYELLVAKSLKVVQEQGLFRIEVPIIEAAARP